VIRSSRRLPSGRTTRDRDVDDVASRTLAEDGRDVRVPFDRLPVDGDQAVGLLQRRIELQPCPPPGLDRAEHERRFDQQPGEGLALPAPGQDVGDEEGSHNDRQHEENNHAPQARCQVGILL